MVKSTLIKSNYYMSESNHGSWKEEIGVLNNWRLYSSQKRGRKGVPVPRSHKDKRCGE